MKSQLRQKVKKRLKELNLTQDDLCYITYISKTSMSKYMKDERIPSTYALMAIATALNVPMSYLVKEDLDDMLSGIVERLEIVRESPEYKKRLESKRRWYK